MSQEQLLEKLNHALNREVSTSLRYILQSAFIKGAQWDAVRKMYENEVTDEIGHAQYLANKIVMLGGTPKLDPDLTPPPEDVRQMLENDIAEEQVDVRAYNDLAEIADELGLADLKMKMEEQAADESNHAEEMTRLLG